MIVKFFFLHSSSSSPSFHLFALQRSEICARKLFAFLQNLMNFLSFWHLLFDICRSECFSSKMILLLLNSFWFIIHYNNISLNPHGYSSSFANCDLWHLLLQTWKNASEIHSCDRKSEFIQLQLMKFHLFMQKRKISIELLSISFYNLAKPKSWLEFIDIDAIAMIHQMIKSFLT